VKRKIKEVCSSSFSDIFSAKISLVILGLIIKRGGKKNKAPIDSTPSYAFSRLSLLTERGSCLKRIMNRESGRYGDYSAMFIFFYSFNLRWKYEDLLVIGDDSYYHMESYCQLPGSITPSRILSASNNSGWILLKVAGILTTGFRRYPDQNPVVRIA